MATDIRVALPHRHGVAMAVLEAVAARGINVDGVCGDLRGGENWGYLHVLVSEDRADETQEAIESLGFKVTTVRNVDVLELEDEPGALARALASYSDHGRNIEVLYMASNTRIVVGPEDTAPPRPGVKISDT